MQDYQYIRQLIVKDYFGELSDDERKFLNDVLLTDEQARRIQQEVYNVDIPEADAVARDLDLEQGFQQFLDKQSVVLERKKQKRRVIYIGSAAAASILAIFLIWRSPGFQQSDPVASHGNTLAMESSNAILHTGNGKSIVLSDSGQQMLNINGTRIPNNNRVLKLTALQDDGSLAGWNTIIVPKRLDYRIELPDGSIVWLNSTTSFRFPFNFTGKTREVYVDAGEAYFKVAANATQPFIVHTQQGDVHVLGTEFNVNNYTPNQVTTSLLSGSVLIASKSTRRQLTPNQQALVSDGRLSVQRFDANIITSWRQGMHYFNDASISEIATMLSRWFDVDLVIDDPAVSRIRFHASMNRNKSLSFFVETMNLTKEAEFYFKDGKLHCKLPR